MGKIKKILENELMGGTQSTEIYPVTSIKAVYDENNERLDHILARRGTVNISTNYNTDHIAEVLTLSEAIAKVPSADRTLGFVATFLTSDGWKTYQFIGDSLTEWSDTSKWEAFGSNIVDTKGNSKVASMSQYAATFYLESVMPYVLLPSSGADEMIQIDYPARKVKVNGSYFIVKNTMPYNSMVTDKTTKIDPYETDFIVPEYYAENYVWLLAYKVEDKKLYYINYASTPKQMDEDGNVLWYPLAYCNFSDGEFRTNFQGTIYYNGVRYSNTMRDFGNMGGWFPLWQDGAPTMKDDITVLMPPSFAMYNYARREVVQIYFDKTEDDPTWENTYDVRHYLISEREINISSYRYVISGFYFIAKKSYNDDYRTIPLVVRNYDGRNWSSILPPDNYGEYSLLGLYRYGKLTTTTTTIDTQTSIKHWIEPKSMSFFGSDPKSTIRIDTVAKKVYCTNGNRIFLTNKSGDHIDRTFSEKNNNIETDILLRSDGGAFSKEELWYLLFTDEDKKVHLVNHSRLSYFFTPEEDEGLGYDRTKTYLLGAGTFESVVTTATVGAGTFEAIGPFMCNGIQYYPSAIDIDKGIQSVPTEKFPFVNTNYTDNLFNKDDVTYNGYWGTTGKTWTPSSEYNTTGFIPVVEGQTYKSVAMMTTGYVYPYNASKNPVQLENGKYFWQPRSAQFTVPSDLNIAYLRIVFSVDNDVNAIMFGLSTADFSSYVPYSVIKIKDEYLPATVATAVGNALYGKSKVGNLQYEEIGEADYNQIILYGQSLSMGWECPEVITTTPIDGNYMVGNNPLINHGNNHDETLHPLIAVKWSSGGEQPIVGCVNSFSKLYRRFVNKNQMFIGSSAGEGGQSIERLSKECTNASGSVVDNNYYHTEFLRLLDQTKAAVDKESKTVNCSAILYMQGEHNYINSGLGMTPGTEATKDKDEYKALLMTLKNNMQADIMAKYGQTQKPLFLIYETAGSYINRKDMSINMAQIEFAQENDDVFLLHPTYPTPDYGGGHLSTNGYRWYGELMAKSLYDILVRGEQYNPVFPMNYTVSDNQLIIDFYVPVPPLVLDTWTKETITNMGFRVYNNDTEVSITDVAVKGTSVVLTCASSLSGTVEVTYAGQGRSGSGNLRDSDTYHSYYTYFDDRETAPSKRENYTPKDQEGAYIYGKPYPMYNWCANFYHKV